MAVSDTLINALFDGRYRVVRKLGSGGMAEVYLAEDEELGRRVAIKILNEKHAEDEQFVERFRREAKSAASLSHPNIVSIYDRGEAEGTYYIAMEYLEGRTLKDTIIAGGPLPVAQAIECTRQILAALRFSHRKGIVHRDIKPHNVLVDADGQLKVTDFGIARAGASQMTEAGSIIGTAQYLSPEQARGTAVDSRSDLYSVGVVLYEMLTGTVPFTGGSPVEIAMKHLSTVPEPPSAKRPEIPRDLDLLVMRALAKDPRDRFQTADEMEAELARVASGLAVTEETADAATAVMAGAGVTDSPTAVTRRPPAPPYVPRAGYPAPYTPPPRRRPLWPWLLALALAVAALVAAFYAYDRIQDELAANRPVTVPNVEGIERALAENRIKDKGLRVNAVEEADETVPAGDVFDQAPAAGEKIAKGNIVTIFVSTGKPRTEVPGVVGRTLADAVAALTAAGLEANPVDVYTEERPNTVVAQFPPPGREVVEGTRVRINVSAGPKPVAVPPVVGQTFDDAKAELEAAGFVVTRVDKDSNVAPDTVIEQNPRANTEHPDGTRVTLTVSRGPKQEVVPDVGGLDEASAKQTLTGSGFKVSVIDEPTDDPAEDGIVTGQDPPGDTRANRGSTVTLFVGRADETTTP